MGAAKRRFVGHRFNPRPTPREPNTRYKRRLLRREVLEIMAPERELGMILLNAFSLNMIVAFPVGISVSEILLDEARALAVAGLTSAVGHADTAAVFSDVLGVTVPSARTTVSLNKGDVVLVGQYRGPRLPEGATRLPDGATIEWLLVFVD